MANLTKTRPTVGRILHAYSNAWCGPRPAIVTQVWGESCCNVNVQLDGANDAELLAFFRTRREGNTFTSISVYDDIFGVEGLVPSSPGFPNLRVVCVWPVAPTPVAPVFGETTGYAAAEPVGAIDQRPAGTPGVVAAIDPSKN